MFIGTFFSEKGVVLVESKWIEIVSSMCTNAISDGVWKLVGRAGWYFGLCSIHQQIHLSIFL